MTEKKPTTPMPFDAAGLPIMAGWLELWMMPVTLTAQMLGMTGPAVEDEPEIDRKCAHKQLPVPNVLQKDMDHDLFA